MTKETLKEAFYKVHDIDTADETASKARAYEYSTKVKEKHGIDTVIETMVRAVELYYLLNHNVSLTAQDKDYLNSLAVECCLSFTGDMVA